MLTLTTKIKPQSTGSYNEYQKRTVGDKSAMKYTDEIEKNGRVGNG